MPQRFRNIFAPHRLVRTLAAGLLLCSATLSFAQQLGNFDEEFDDEEKPWQEIAVQLPPAPLPENLAEFYLSDLDFPLRGYDIYDFEGTRKFLTNLEFRFPFVQQLAFASPVPLAISNVMGNLFVDWGGAWSSGDPLSQMGVGFGYGLRLNLGIFILKYTRAESVDGLGGYHHGTRHYWSMGSEF